MRSLLPLFACLLLAQMLRAQGGVGINNPTPHASALLDLTSTDKGLLVPRMTTAQRDGIPLPATSLLVYNTTTARFEFFNGSAWVPLNNPGWSLTGNSGTNPATNFIGTTDNTAFRFRVNNANAGFIDPTSRTVALGRFAGHQTVTGTGGNFSVAIGDSAGFRQTFSVNGNTMVGAGAGLNNQLGYMNTFIGFRAGYSSTGLRNTLVGMEAGRSITTGSDNAFLGPSSGRDLIQGSNNSALGAQTRFGSPSITNSTVIGHRAQVDQSDAIVLGSISGTNGATITSNVGIGTTSPADRLHVVGSIRMVDGNQAAGRVLVSDANGRASWTDPGTTSSGTLDQAYDFGGAGAGRTITADAGAVMVGGTDGFVSTGTMGSGALTPSGEGTRMVWNPRKAAFRAGTANATSWDDANMGQGSFATGTHTRATGQNAVALGQLTNSNGLSSFAAGQVNTASGNFSSALNFLNNAVGNASTAMGSGNSARSFGETVLGIGATNYTTALNGATEWRPANATDRLLVVGNAIDANSNNVVDDTERSDALVILKNGNTGIGVPAPSQRLHVAGRALFHNGFSANNAALLYRSDTDYMFIGPESGSSANGAAIALYGSTNVVGGNTNGMDVNVPNGRVRFNHTGGQFEFRANSTSGYTATMELNDVGLQIGHNSASRTIHFVNSGGERMRIAPNGNVGIGAVPTTRLHVAGQIRMADGTEAVGRVMTSDANGVASWVDPGAATSGTLDHSYDFGGAGAGRTISADAGAVNIGGTDGLQVTGTFGTGATIALAGAGTRMFFNPRKAAFRVGRAFGTDWNDANVGNYSVAMGVDGRASGLASTTFGSGCQATADYSAAWGLTSRASGSHSTAWGRGNASATGATAWGTSNASGSYATASGFATTAYSYAETVIGSFNRTYVPSSTAAWNNADRLFVIGNGHDTDGDGTLLDFERSNALVMLKNGNTGLGNIVPAFQLQLSTNSAAKPGSTTWTVVSDARLKSDIRPFTDGIQTLLAIDPIWYTYTGDAGMPQERFVGTLAQELQKVAPYMVKPWTWHDDHTGHSQEFLSIDYGAMDFVMINALKEQQTMINELREELRAVRSEMEELRRTK